MKKLFEEIYAALEQVFPELGDGTKIQNIELRLVESGLRAEKYSIDIEYGVRPKELPTFIDVSDRSKGVTSGRFVEIQANEIVIDRSLVEDALGTMKRQMKSDDACDRPFNEDMQTVIDQLEQALKA